MKEKMRSITLMIAAVRLRFAMIFLAVFLGAMKDLAHLLIL